MKGTINSVRRKVAVEVKYFGRHRSGTIRDGAVAIGDHERGNFWLRVIVAIERMQRK